MKFLAKLAGLILKEPIFVIAALLLGFLTIESSVGLMVFSAVLISDAALHFALADLTLLIVGVRALGIGRAVFRYAERYVSHSATFRILSRLRVWFYDRLEPLVPWKTGGLHSGDLFSRMVSDVESLKEFFLRVFNPPMVAICVAAVAVAVLRLIDLRLVLVFIVFFTAAGLLVPWTAGKIGRESGKKTALVRSGINRHLLDCFSGISEVIAFNLEHSYSLKLKKLSKELMAAQKRLAMAGSFSSAATALSGGLCMWLALVICIPLVSSGSLRGDLLAAIAIGLVSTFEALQPMSLYFNKLEGSLAAAGRVFDVIDGKAAAGRASDTIHRAADGGPEKKDIRLKNFNIRLDNVSLRYSPERPSALENINFELSSGAKTAIVGANGSGKSSLLQVLCGILPCDGGQVLIGDVDVQELDKERVMDLFSVVPQNAYIFNSTVLENLRLADLEASSEKIMEMLAVAQLEDFIAGLPDGLDTFIGEGGFKLSGGQRQRLAIARALLRDRPILVLDEPFTGLDPVTEEKLFQALQKIWSSKSVLLITHDTRRLEAMDEIFVLSHGRVAEHGTHHDLMNSGGLYCKMRLRQQEG